MKDEDLLRILDAAAEPDPGRILDALIQASTAERGYLVTRDGIPVLRRMEKEEVQVSTTLLARATADGRPLAVFDWFSVPALIHDKPMEKTAGELHELLADITMILVLLHAVASLKHHFIDRSRVLARMWSGPPKNQQNP